MNHADRIRSQVAKNHVVPARRRGDETVTVVAGVVLRELELRSDRAASVCSALRAVKFRKKNDLELMRVDGPPSKQSTTTTFTFRILKSTASGERPARHALRDLLGAGKATFTALGGGEQWLQREREVFGERGRGAGAVDRQGSPD